MDETKSPIQWWDCGRARWRSRPAKKERSFDERVGARRGACPKEFAAARGPVRSALARYCVDRDEPALDRRVAALGRARLDPHWWTRTRTKRDALQFKRLSRVLRYGSSRFIRRPWRVRSRWLRALECWKSADSWHSRFAIIDALTAATREWCASPASQRPRRLEDDPRFVQHVPHGWRRRSLAKRCVSALLARREMSTTADMLGSLLRMRGPSAPMYAALVSSALLGDAQTSRDRELFGRNGELSRRLRRAVERDPSLAERVRAWVSEHAMTEREIERAFALPW